MLSCLPALYYPASTASKGYWTVPFSGTSGWTVTCVISSSYVLIWNPPRRLQRAVGSVDPFVPSPIQMSGAPCFTLTSRREGGGRAFCLSLADHSRREWWGSILFQDPFEAEARFTNSEGEKEKERCPLATTSQSRLSDLAKINSNHKGERQQ